MRWTVLLAVGLFSLLPTAAVADSSSQVPVVAPVQAAGIFDDLWAQRESAARDRNRQMLPSVEEGPALDYDLAWMEGLVANRVGGSGYRGLVGQRIVVPDQTSSPAFFVALASVTTHPDPTGSYVYWTDLLIIVRDAANAPWRIRLESWAQTVANTDALSNAIASDQPEQFAPRPSTAIVVQDLVNQLSPRYRSYAAQPVNSRDLYLVGLPSGGALFCFARDYIQAENRPWWHPVNVGPADRRGIPEGVYRTLTSAYLEQQCGLIDADTPMLATPITSQGAFISHQEVPAPPPPWLLVGLAGCLVSLIAFIAVWRLKPPAPQAPRPAHAISIRSMERHGAIASAARVLLGALMVVEVERWVLVADPLFAALIALFVLLLVAARVFPGRRIIRCTARILISRPIEDVYAFASDLRNEPKWDPLVLSVDRMTDGTDRVYHGRQRLLPHLVLDFQTRAQEEPEDRVIRYTVLGKWFPERAEWRFTPARDGTLVTIVRWFELGPLRAIAYGVARYRNGLRAMTIRDLNQLRRVLSNEEAPKPKLETGPHEVMWQYKVIKMIPGIRESDIAITIATFLICWLIYSWATSEWFATGLMVMLLIHEMGHYVEGHRLGFKPRPPVFILGGAFVYLSGVRSEPLNNARVSFAGAIAGGAATAVVLSLAAAGGWTQLLPWAAAGAGANLFGSLLPFITVDVESILHVVGRWLPLVGVFAAGCVWLAAAALGVGDLLIPLIVVLAFVVLALRYPGGSYLDGGTLFVRARLVLAASWLAMLFYLSVVFVLTAGWLY